MNRRHVAVGLGGLIAGGGVLAGTGAFTIVEAQRTVSVETTGDANALLAMRSFRGSDNTDYVTVSDDGVVQITITRADTDAPGAGVNTNAVTAIDRILRVTNNGTQRVAVGFRDEYALTEGDYDESELPGGWGYAISDDQSAAVVLWACPLPARMEKTLSAVRPKLNTTGFGGSTTLVDGRNDDEVDEVGPRTIAPGEALHVGAIVDTRERTINDSLPESIEETVTLLATSAPNNE